MLTMNIALSDDAAHGGGALLAIYDGSVQHVVRGEGGATVHPSGVQHAVTRMYSGIRYSLILFYHQVCPDARHALVACDAVQMDRLYSGGAYSCDSCGESAADLALRRAEAGGEALPAPRWWHCSEGCEYDMCDECHSAVSWTAEGLK